MPLALPSDANPGLTDKSKGTEQAPDVYKARLKTTEGDIVIERDGDAIAMVGPGTVVGEQALLLNEPRNATVTAASDVVVAAMSRREFTSILEACPTIGRRILNEALTRAAA